MKNLKIQTHTGIFHADEVLAIALITIWGRHHLAGPPSFEIVAVDKVVVQSPKGDMEILRSHDLSTTPEMDLVVDIGGELDLERGLLDHHQYAGGKAACELALDWLEHHGRIAPDTAEYIRPYLESVSRWDTGESLQKQGDLLKEEKMVNIPQAISGFNRVGEPGDIQIWSFLKAVVFAVEWLFNLKYAGEKAIKSLCIVEGAEVSSGALVCDEHPTQWKEQVDDSVRYLVSPSAYNPEQYQVLSRDSAQWPLPDNGAPGMVFIHKAQFIAAFVDKASAVDYASKLGEV